MKDIVVKQNDYSSCGACSLLSIIKYYGGYVPLEIIKLDTLTDNNGTSFYNLKEASIKYGFEAIGYKNANIESFNPPFIVQIKSNNLFHFMVVYEVHDDYLLCMDPNYGIKKYFYRDFKKIFTGNILKLSPINQIVHYKKNNYLKDLFIRMYKQNFMVFLFIEFLSVVVFILSLINTFYLKDITNNIKLIIIFIIILLLKNMLDYIKNSLLAYLNKNNNNYLIKDYLNHIFSLPSKYLQLNRKGEITSRINDLNNIKDLFTREAVNLLIYSLFLLIILLIMFIMNYRLSIFLIFLSALYLLSIYLINKKGFKYYLNYLNSNGNLMDSIIEKIYILVNIKNLGKEEYFLNKLYLSLNDNTTNQYKLDKYLNMINVINHLYRDFSLVLIFIISRNVSNILIYILYYNYYQEIITYYGSILPNISYFKGILSRLNGIYYLTVNDDNKGSKLIKNNNIKINNLSYVVNLNNIFYNYNLNIKSNEKVLIKGSNGIGKSTLLNIINGNIDEFEGTIIIGQENIKNISKKSLKKKVLYCGDKDSLYVDTVLNNIILDMPFDNKKFHIIENILFLKSIVSKKENMYETIVNDNFSGGERQRIILARCLYMDSDILLLDEALSEVNYYLRHKIIYQINNYYKNKTIIYVSHNLEDNYFDRIINLTARKD